jgi:hypothetical protein
MQRLQLFEFNDSPGVPKAIRRAQIDYLTFAGNLTPWPYREFIGHLRSGLEETGSRRIIELCAGAGGPTPTLAKLLRDGGYPLESVVQTDLFPDAKRFAEREHATGGLFRGCNESVDALDVPQELDGFRLICNAFHHFEPDMARGILSDTIDKKQGICIVELAGRSPASMAWISGMAATMGLGTPFIRPARPASWLLTYGVPVVPALTLWDGLVSCMRVYSPHELHGLVHDVESARARAGHGASEFRWDIGRCAVPGTPAQITYLVGYPR